MQLSLRTRFLWIFAGVAFVLALGFLLAHFKKTECIGIYAEGIESPLLLTKYIKSNLTLEGRQKAHGIWKDVSSYSGYFTVNEPINSNLFFWFFPALGSNKKTEDSPLLLYLSFTEDVFNGIGPLFLNNTKNIEKRETSWGVSQSVLYIEPSSKGGLLFITTFNKIVNEFTDAGYSYSNDSAYESKITIDLVTMELYDALIQFYSLFDEYKDRQLYISGPSYSGKYVVALAYHIHNVKEETVQKINLKGIIIDSAYLGSSLITKYSDYYQNLGFIDKLSADYYRGIENNIAAMIRTRSYEEAYKETSMLLEELSQTAIGSNQFSSKNAIQIVKANEEFNYSKFLERSCVKDALHTNMNKSYINAVRFLINSTEKEYRSYRPELEALLNANYKILQYGGQFDMLLPHQNVQEFLEQLNWIRSNEFLNTRQILWEVNGTLAGWIRKVQGLSYVIFRNTGSEPCNVNAVFCQDMIEKFILEN